MAFPSTDLNGQVMFNDFQDDLGFVFDPFDVYISDLDGSDHLEELSFLKSYEWVDRNGDVVRMDKIEPKNIRRLINIVLWIQGLKSETVRFDYMQSRQFRYARKRIVKLQRRINVAQRILSKPIGWSRV